MTGTGLGAMRSLNETSPTMFIGVGLDKMPSGYIDVRLTEYETGTLIIHAVLCLPTILVAVTMTVYANVLPTTFDQISLPDLSSITILPGWVVSDQVTGLLPCK